MKPIKLLVMLVLAAFMAVSCSDDDNSEVAGNEYETTYLKTEIFGEDGNATTSLEYDTKSELVDNEMYMVITLEENGDYLIDGFKAGTWTLDGSTLNITSTIDDEDDDEDLDFDYVLNGNKITAETSSTEDGVTVTMMIVYTKK